MKLCVHSHTPEDSSRSGAGLPVLSTLVCVRSIFQQGSGANGCHFLPLQDPVLFNTLLLYPLLVAAAAEALASREYIFATRDAVTCRLFPLSNTGFASCTAHSPFFFAGFLVT